MSSYLFIDGAYLKKAHADTMQEFFGEIPALLYPQLASYFGSSQRVYYYDAVDRSSVGNETPEQTRTRVDEMNDFHVYLNSLVCWHVREGFVSRGRRARRRSQKGVDVQLAVDALEHAVAHNMSTANFIFGDLDFEPLLFSLNRFGIQTHVWYERESASRELLEAADRRHQLTVQTFHGLSPVAFRERVPSPQISERASQPSYPILKKGLWKGRYVQYSAANTLEMANLWVAPGTEPDRDPSISVHLGQPGENGEAKVLRLFKMTYGGEIENWRDGHVP